MRLTLRTMLAYMDNILDPDDAREIGRKIEESEFAKSLMHRLQDVMRRLRLAAPNASDRGVLDPNTVAEYLDNTLPNDRVPDFEKICLESDVQLAEVGSCHQILTLVLGEPAEIDPLSRERMYRLLGMTTTEATPPAEAEPAGTPPPIPADLQVARPIRQRPSVPDYLREPLPQGNRFLPWAGSLALIAVLVLVALAALGQFESGSELARFLGISKPESETTQEPPVPTPEPTPTPAATATTEPQPSADPLATAPPVAASTTPAPVAAPDAALPPATTQPGAVQPALTPPTEVATPPSSAPASPKPTSIVPPTGLSTTPSAPPATSGEAKPPAMTPGAAEMAALPTPATRKPTEPPPEPAPLPSQRLGKYVSDKQVLLQREFSEGGWTRRPPQTELNSGLALLALPSFQPVLALNVGIAIPMLGGSELTLLPGDAQDPPGMDVDFGRLFVRAVGDAKGGLRIKIGDRVGTVRFRNPDAFLAVEVGRARLPGADPEADPGPVRGTLYAASGEFEWTESVAHPPIQVTAPAVLRIDQQPELRTVAANDLPKWLFNDDVSLLDRRAAPTIETALQVNRPVVLSLRELADHRQREVGWLAVRSLGYVGEFDAMVAILNSPDSKNVPDEYIAQLQLAVDRGPATAAMVRKALEKQYGQDGHALYRMLWGYSEKQIDGGQGEQLVSYLESDFLAFRVLAFYILEKLTGVKYSYRPYDPPSKRQVAVARWKDRLQTGLLGTRAGDSSDKKTPPAKPAGSLF